MSTTQTTSLEPGNRLQLPGEWAESLGLHGLVILERTDAGILIRPFPPVTWDEVFADKLPVGPPTSDSEELEIERNDLFL
jgi:hypothetical protein